MLNKKCVKISPKQATCFLKPNRLSITIKKKEIMNSDITKELLFKYFEGQATPIEKQWIDAWAKEAAHQELFFACLMQWENQNYQHNPDAKQAFKKHLERMETAAIKTEIVEPMRSFSIGRRWAIAASIAVLLTIGGGFLFKNNIIYKNYTTDYGEIKSLILDDGTHVVLNANSSLKVPRFGFGTDTREVFFTGEANFDVTHTIDNQHFVVKTAKDFEVVVLGTEFSVFARASGSKVVLDRGKIQLNYSENKTTKQLTMKPGDLVTLDAIGKAKLKQTKTPQNLSAWKDNRFVFDETPLSDLTQLFADNFDLKLIIMDKELAKWTISGSFTAHNGEELLELLAEASDLKYHKEGKSIFIATK